MLNRNSNINERVAFLSNYINKSEILTRILERETEFYKQNQADKAAALFETKEQYINELENAKSILLADINFLKSLPQETKKNIIEVSEKLRKAAEENYNEVLVAKEVNKLVLEAIYHSNVEYSNRSSGYGKTGTVYASSTSAPIAISESA